MGFQTAFLILNIVVSRNFGAFAVRRSLKSQLNYSCTGSVRRIRMENNFKKDSRGALVVFEGLDRCGKTTQCSRLLKHLEELGHSAELWRFPDRTTSVGRMISSYLSNQSQLDDHTVHLLFSANRWEKRFVMLFKYYFLSCFSQDYNKLIILVGSAQSDKSQYFGYVSIV